MMRKSFREGKEDTTIFERKAKKSINQLRVRCIEREEL